LRRKGSESRDAFGELADMDEFADVGEFADMGEFFVIPREQSML